MIFRLRSSLVIALFASVGLSGCASEIGTRIREAARQGAEDAAVREAYDRSERAVTGAIECLAGDRACAEQARQQGRSVVLVDASGDPLPDDQQPASVGSADANVNFTPGAQTLYANDFARDDVGDFPRSLHYLSGTMEVVDVGGRRMLRATSGGVFQVRLPERLPQSFTIEFDVQTANQANVSIFAAAPTRDDDSNPFSGYEGAYLNVGSWRGSGVWSGGGPQSVKEIERDVTLPVQITVDGEYVKMYVGGERTANVPRADLGRSDALTFTISSRADRELYLGDLRVAAGGNDLYDLLATDGSLTLGGVEFESGSARLRAGSAGVLDGVAAMLQEHGDLRLRVEGHTDDTGSAAGNERLSQQRAEAVQTYLTGRGVAAGRLEPVGMGPAQPVADNGTAEGRQRNRRVVLVRL